MPATKPNSNNTLPFDVLGDIFSYYAKGETIHHPLETLLLVCRSWSEAALGHKTLWTDFRIYLGHYPTAKIWSARIPLRLARAGRTTPLSIDLRNFLTLSEDNDLPVELEGDPLYEHMSFCVHHGTDNSHSKDEVDNGDDICPCYEALHLCISSFLKLFAGENGSLSTCWRRVRLDLGHYDGSLRGDRSLAAALSYPTPSLTTLNLNGILFHDGIELPPLFPEVPRLEEISLEDCKLPSFPSFENVERARIIWKELEEVQHSPGFRNATRLETLRLRFRSSMDIPIPPQMPSLKCLSIGGDNFPPSFYGCDMPSLTVLDIDILDENFLASLLKCEGFYPERLSVLSIDWTVPDWEVEYQLVDIITALVQLFRRSPSLPCIIGNGYIIGAIFKVLWEFHGHIDEIEDKSLPTRREATQQAILKTCLSSIDNGQEIHIRGDETRKELEETAKLWGLVPIALSMGEYVEQLKRLSALNTILGY